MAEQMLKEYQNVELISKQVAQSTSKGRDKLEELYLQELESSQMTPEDFFVQVDRTADLATKKNLHASMATLKIYYGNHLRAYGEKTREVSLFQMLEDYLERTEPIKQTGAECVQIIRNAHHLPILEAVI